MILVREKLPFVATLLIEHFRGLRIFRGSTSTARRAGRSTSQGSWSDQCVREAGASNAVCYTAEPCNEYKSTGKITRQASAGRKNGRRGTRRTSEKPGKKQCFPRVSPKVSPIRHLGDVAILRCPKAITDAAILHLPL